MDKEKRAKALADKYLDGLTTADEERWLMDYLADDDNQVPQELVPLKALATYIGEEKQAAAAPEAPRRSTKARLRFFITSAGAAAGGGGRLVTYINRQDNSYAVIDGKVYTDRQTVNEEALDALQIVASDCDDTFDALELMQ